MLNTFSSSQDLGEASELIKNKITIIFEISLLLRPALYVEFPSFRMQFKTIDNETAYLIIYCLNYIRREGNSTYKTGLTGLTRLSGLVQFPTQTCQIID